jgi:hypothetical protein
MGHYYMPDGGLRQCFHAPLLTPLTTVQYILCDVICAWRTVVLWRNDKWVIAVLVFFITGTTGT